MAQFCGGANPIMELHANLINNNGNSMSKNLNNNHNQAIILIAKFDYKSKEEQELSLKKNERLILIDNSKKWWLVKKVDDDKTGYVPSNYVKKEKRSLFEKIIPRKLQHQLNVNNSNFSISNSNHHPNEIKQNLLHNNSNKISPANNNNNNNNNNNTNGNNNIHRNNFISKAIVKHKYNANKADELTLKVGYQVNVIEKFGDGWWKVCYFNEENQEENPNDSNNNNGEESDDKQLLLIGLYPSNYLQEENTTNQLNVKIKPSSSNEKVSITTTNLNESSFLTQLSPRTPNEQNHLDINSVNKCESVSSNEKEVEYLRVIFPHTSTRIIPNELSVEHNEIVKLIEEDNECIDCEKSWIKVFNSQGIIGMIPSSCVEPLLDNHLSDFVFIRRPTIVGLFANYSWYFGNITRFETVLMFNKYANNGDYLVRDSDNSNYSISLKSENGNNKHFKIFYKENKFLIGKKIFNTMTDLLEHYYKNPIFDQNGEKLYLIKPFEPPSFDSLFDKLSSSSNPSSSSLTRNFSQLSTTI